MRFFGQNVNTPIFQKVVFGGIEDGYKSLFKIGFINIVNTKIFGVKLTICQLFVTFFCKNRPNWRNYPQIRICQNQSQFETKMASSSGRFGPTKKKSQQPQVRITIIYKRIKLVFRFKDFNFPPFLSYFLPQISFVGL